jgi:hypothetical protein
MPALAEAPEGRSRTGQLLVVEGDDLDAPACQELVQVVARVLALVPFEDHRGLERKDLIPFVDRTYRTNGDRGPTGHSGRA